MALIITQYIPGEVAIYLDAQQIYEALINILMHRHGFLRAEANQWIIDNYRGPNGETVRKWLTTD